MKDELWQLKLKNLLSIYHEHTLPVKGVYLLDQILVNSLVTSVTKTYSY